MANKTRKHRGGKLTSKQAKTLRNVLVAEGSNFVSVSNILGRGNVGTRENILEFARKKAAAGNKTAWAVDGNRIRYNQPGASNAYINTAASSSSPRPLNTRITARNRAINSMVGVQPPIITNKTRTSSRMNNAVVNNSSIRNSLGRMLNEHEANLNRNNMYRRNVERLVNEPSRLRANAPTFVPAA